MKLSTALVAVAATAATTSAFSPSTLLSQKSLLSSSSSSSARYFLDTSGNKADAEGAVQNPVRDIQSYIPSPEPVEIRNKLSKSTCLVTTGKTILPEVFYLLNNEDSAFEFDKIVAVTSDITSTKKQLLTRQARYTGLLNKLDYAETTSVLPPTELLEEASSWVAVIDSLADLTMIGQHVGQVENVSILYVVTPSDSQQEIKTAIEYLQSVNPDASVVMVDQAALTVPQEDPLVLEGKESKPLPPLLFYQDYAADNTEHDVAVDPAFMHEESLRMVTECLQLKAASGKVLQLSLVENDATQSSESSMTHPQLFPILVKGLRQAGYERPQEIDYMLRSGVQEYASAIESFEQENPTAQNGIVHTNAWWEDENFQKMVKESSLRKEELIAANLARETKLLEQEQEEKFA